MSQSLLKAIGMHAHWGFSHSFDFLELLNKMYNNDVVSSETCAPINILLIHPSDVRHILTLIARRRRHSNIPLNRPINIYLLENTIENVARDILLLEVINDYEVPIRQRANIYLEIFGNCKVQDRTSRYIEQLGYQLRSLICDSTGRLEDLIDFSLFKYRDRDLLENVFKSYSRSVIFDIDKLIDTRLRAHYGDRYDSRKAMADWDYHTSIRESASIIHIKQYKDWRMKGIAYEFGDQEYTEPNRTMMSYTEGFLKEGKEKGMKKEVKGYWGDIVASPYFSYGIDTDISNKLSEGLFQILNKNTGSEQHRHHAVEIAVHDMLSNLWEIENGTKYQMTKANDIFSGLGKERGQIIKEEEPLNEIQDDTEDSTQDSKNDIDTEVENKQPIVEPNNSNSEVTTNTIFKNIISEEEELAKSILRAETIVETFQNIKILPMFGSPNDILNKSKYKNMFDGIYVSSRIGQCMEQDYFKDLLKNDEKNPVVVAIETAKYIVTLNKDTKKAFQEKEIEYITRHGLKPLAPELTLLRRKRNPTDDKDDDVIFYTR
jgi:dynein assembly factor 3